jgi:hypothetical protein
MRLPACDFGVSVRRAPLSGCERVSLMRISPAPRSRFSRRSPASSPQRISAKVASRTKARYRAGTALAISKTTGSGTICRSSDSSLPAPSMWHGLRGMKRSSSAAVSKMAPSGGAGRSRCTGGEKLILCLYLNRYLSASTRRWPAAASFRSNLLGPGRTGACVAVRFFSRGEEESFSIGAAVMALADEAHGPVPGSAAADPQLSDRSVGMTASSGLTRHAAADGMPG